MEMLNEPVATKTGGGDHVRDVLLCGSYGGISSMRLLAYAGNITFLFIFMHTSIYISSRPFFCPGHDAKLHHTQIIPNREGVRDPTW